MDFSCSVFKDSHGSDHCPIQLSLVDTESHENERRPRWNFKKANWDLFKKYCNENVIISKFVENSEDMILADNDKMVVFTDLILNGAMEAIPQTSCNPKKKPKPYFDDDCNNIVKERKSAFKESRDVPSPENIRKYQIIRAKCRRVIKRKKRSSWRQYVSSVNSQTPIKKVWERIRKITGKNSNKLIHHSL